MRLRLHCAMVALLFSLFMSAWLLGLLGIYTLGSFTLMHIPNWVFVLVFYGFLAVAFARLVLAYYNWHRWNGPHVLRLMLTDILRNWNRPSATPNLGPVAMQLPSAIGRLTWLFLQVVYHVLKGLPNTLDQLFTPFSREGRRHLLMLASFGIFILLTIVMGRILNEPPVFASSFLVASLEVSAVGGIATGMVWNLFDPSGAPTQPQRILSGMVATGIGLWTSSAVHDVLPVAIWSDMFAFMVWLLLIPTLLAFVYQCSKRGTRGLLSHLGSLMDNPS